MRNPKFFLLIVFILSIALFLFDLPKGIHVYKFSFNPSEITIPFTKVKKDFSYKLGLDLQGGTRLIYNVDMTSIPKDQQDAAFEGVRNVIERRINFFGVTEPSIQTLKLPGDYRVIVELPGLTNINQAIDLIGKTAQLTFWEQGTKTNFTPLDTSATGNSSFSAILLQFGLQQVFGTYSAQTKLTGKDLKSAKVVFDSRTGEPQVQLNFTPNGAKLFGDLTKKNVGRPVAIVLDNQVIQAPRVNEPILSGNAVISGAFTQEQAKQVAIQLNAGALPAPLKIIGQNSVGPSLGIVSLKKSVFAGLVGLISIIIFMTYLYRKEGFLASLALFVYTVMVLFIFKAFSVTLTLAGIAGFILSIGMAVDANILIFERMREELRSAKPRDIAVRLGFNRAWTSIRDSNISSLITSFILYYFGSGIVRGFAITLAIGILVSMFSAITVTRNLLRVFEKEKGVRKA